MKLGELGWKILWDVEKCWTITNLLKSIGHHDSIGKAWQWWPMLKNIVNRCIILKNYETSQEKLKNIVRCWTIKKLLKSIWNHGNIENPDNANQWKNIVWWLKVLKNYENNDDHHWNMVETMR